MDRYHTRGRKHKLVEDHPFSGDSAECRDTVEQTFRVTFGVEIHQRPGVGSVRLRHRRESPRKCALSADENINFVERSAMRYGESVQRIRRFAISHYPLFAAGLTIRLTLADHRPFVLSVTSHAYQDLLPWRNLYCGTVSYLMQFLSSWNSDGKRWNMMYINKWLLISDWLLNLCLLL